MKDIYRIPADSLVGQSLTWFNFHSMDVHSVHRTRKTLVKVAWLRLNARVFNAVAGNVHSHRLFIDSGSSNTNAEGGVNVP